MAKRKTLKKEIGYTAGDLFLETLFCKLYIPGVDQEKADVVMAKILNMQDEYICRANRPAGNGNKSLVKSYYAKLRTDLQQEVNAIAVEIETLSK